MRIVLGFLLLVSVCFLTSGCGYKDIDKRFFVIAIGIDSGKSEDTIKISLKMAIPNTEPAKGTHEFLVLTEESGSIAESVQRLRARVDKELEFGHVKIIFLGEQFLRRNYSPSIDWIARSTEIQQIAYFAAAKPDAQTLLKQPVASERLPGNAYFLTFSREGIESQYITYENHLFEFFRKYTEKGVSPILPVVEENKADKTFVIKSAAILDRSKLQQLLNPEETELLNMVMNATSAGYFTYNHGENFVAFSFRNIKSTYRIERNPDNSYTIKVNLHTDAIVEEKGIQIGNENRKLNEYTNGANANVSQAVKKLLIKLQKKNLDPVGFGIAYRAMYREDVDKEWKKWQQLYPEASIEVETTIRVISKGVIK